MENGFKIFNRWLAAFGLVAFLMVAGWQVGAGGTDEVFSETKVALENAVAGSGNTCYQRMVICNGHYTVYHCDDRYTSSGCSKFEYGCYNC